MKTIILDGVEYNLVPRNDKITITEFLNTSADIAINCRTAKQATKLVNEFHKRGITWCDGASYLNNSCWEDNRGGIIAYSNQMYYARMGYFDARHTKIYEFKDVIFDKETETCNATIEDISNLEKSSAPVKKVEVPKNDKTTLKEFFEDIIFGETETCNESTANMNLDETIEWIKKDMERN